jgi:hypothetical protein
MKKKFTSPRPEHGPAGDWAIPGGPAFIAFIIVRAIRARGGER